MPSNCNRPLKLGHTCMQPCLTMQSSFDSTGRRVMCNWSLQEVFSSLPEPQARQLFGRDKEEQAALAALGVQQFVELRAGPGEGKSTLVLHLAQRLCAQWQQQPKPQNGGGTAHAHMVDLRGEL